MCARNDMHANYSARIEQFITGVLKSRDRSAFHCIVQLKGNCLFLSSTFQCHPSFAVKAIIGISVNKNKVNDIWKEKQFYGWIQYAIHSMAMFTFTCSVQMRGYFFNLKSSNACKIDCAMAKMCDDVLFQTTVWWM